MRQMIALCCGLVVATPLVLNGQAVVHYQRGRRLLRGVQLLQAYGDSTAYMYVPIGPRLAQNDDSTYQLLMIKYVGNNAEASGGLFHALVEFTLPQSAVDSLERDLRREQPAAHIVGPVPLVTVAPDKAEGVGSFQIVSSTLGDSGFRRSVVTSGGAPVTAGSRAAIAANLRPEGATLLWNSLTNPTSDVSISIHTYYDAVAEGYNAKVTAEVATIYEHFSRVSQKQKEFRRRQLRNIVDSLHRDGTLKVEVLDLTAGTGIKAGDMDALLQLVTDKLVELMFDHQSGWSADPEREPGVEPGQLAGRQEEGFFAKIFGGGDTPYYTDDQYVLKRREDIRRNTFVLLLSKSGTVRVPVDATGNLAGLFRHLGDHDRYFRVIDMADPDFLADTAHFQVDGTFTDAFRDLVNFVTVNVRKTYPDRPTFTKSVELSPADVAKGKTILDVVLPRLNLTGNDAAEFEYQTDWSYTGGSSARQPPGEQDWIRTSDHAISLSPPIDREVVEIDCDRRLLQSHKLATAVVQFATYLAGSLRRDRQVTLRAGDAESTTRVVIYHDHNQPVAYRASWYGEGAPPEAQQPKVRLLESDYLYLTPPDSTGKANGGTPP